MTSGYTWYGWNLRTLILTPCGKKHEYNTIVCGGVLFAFGTSSREKIQLYWCIKF